MVIQFCFSVTPENLDSRYSLPPNQDALFVRNLSSGQTQLVSLNFAGDQVVSPTSVNNLGITSDFVLSANGRVAVFLSTATNAHPLDTDATVDVFARDLVTGTTYFVSDDTRPAGNVGNAGCFEPAVSADGNIIAYTAEVSNLEILVRNLATGATVLASPNVDGVSTKDHESWGALVSADGHNVVFNSLSNDLVIGDTNGLSDVFLATIAWSAPSLPGDFNSDGSVDSADYVAWRKTAGTVLAPYSGADGSGNGVVGAEDYDVWRANFGRVGRAGRSR